MLPPLPRGEGWGEGQTGSPLNTQPSTLNQPVTLQDSYAKSIDTIWSNPDLLKPVTYVRPPGLTHDSSTVEPTETRATCSALVGPPAVAGLGRTARDTRPFTIRASELTAILALGGPRKGDYILDADNNTFAVYSANPILGDLAWRIYTTETFDEDHGAIALAHTATADHGDLTLETIAEDHGPLYL